MLARSSAPSTAPCPGYVGGALDAFLMRLVDGVLAIPALFLLLVLSCDLLHPGTAIMILLIAALSWLGAARLIRGEALSLREREYVQAVKVMGGAQHPRGGPARRCRTRSARRRVRQFTVADAIIILAVPRFLGLGIQPPKTDWGGMLSTATNYINSGYWWLLYPPGIAIILVAIAFNFIGDALRDAFEVRLQSR